VGVGLKSDTGDGVGARLKPGTHTAVPWLRYERRDAAVVSQSQPEAYERGTGRPAERSGVGAHGRPVQGGQSGGSELLPDLRCVRLQHVRPPLFIKYLDDELLCVKIHGPKA
jgi:hypothetical protein